MLESWYTDIYLDLDFTSNIHFQSYEVARHSLKWLNISVEYLSALRVNLVYVTDRYFRRYQYYISQGKYCFANYYFWRNFSLSILNFPKHELMLMTIIYAYGIVRKASSLRAQAWCSGDLSPYRRTQRCSMHFLVWQSNKAVKRIGDSVRWADLTIRLVLKVNIMSAGW